MAEYEYHRRRLAEPDWTRLPGWRTVTAAQWQSAHWQRTNSVRTVRRLREILGSLVGDRFYRDLAADQARWATMPLLVTPQILNTMVPAGPVTTDAFYADPVRRYMLPVASDRRTDWPSHPLARRDPLQERDMSIVDGLVHRYPTKVLAELVATCPQYCGHCTRMDLVGGSTQVVRKARLALRPAERFQAQMAYLRVHRGVRDVVVSGGDAANVPWHRLESYLQGLLEIDSIRDIRVATKALVGLPQQWLQPVVLEGLARVAGAARERGVNLAVHTHINHVNSVTPLVARAARAVLDAGVRDVRNQGVLLRGVNDSGAHLLDLCFALQDDAHVLPYYFYLCDMVPNSEHWRLPVWRAQRLQHELLGRLPGYATPRIVCDVPLLGKQWVHMVAEYDRERGISYWSRSYRTPLDPAGDAVPARRFPYYDPIDTLPKAGRDWWARTGSATDESSSVARGALLNLADGHRNPAA